MVRGVDDGVNAQRGDVGDDDLELGAANPARQHGRVSGRDDDALLGEELLQFASLEHLADDVAAAHELALHIKLGDRRPIGEGLDAVAQFGGFENVEALIADPDMVEDLDDCRRNRTAEIAACPS